MTRNLKFNEAILEATSQLLTDDPDVYVMGLGVPDPKGIFGTTLGLQETFGNKRVMDMPTAENGMTGIAIGSALTGMRPIMTHQRLDFFLLALDQLINNGAKWHYMFGGKLHVPLVIRLIIGRGWGQGPQHSQSLHSLFTHIPGLKVVAPSCPEDAKGLLIAASRDNNPVIYLEHRWLHGTYGPTSQRLYETPIGKARIIHPGTDLTIVASSHMTLEARRATALLEQEGVSAEIIDLRTLKPLDENTIIQSIRKTGRLLVLDGDWKTCGFAGEILALSAEKAFHDLKAPPVRLTYPDRYSPTSWSLANHFYPTAQVIAMEAFQLMRFTLKAQKLIEELMETRKSLPLDVPDSTFTGPF